jgi:general stress protein 26
MPSPKATSTTAKAKHAKSSDKQIDTQVVSETTMKDNIPPAKKIEELYSLVEGIDIAMMTTRDFEGTLVSRPMATQEKRPGVDFWFVSSTETHKVDELQAQPEVNLAYYNNTSGEWVSVSGTARLVSDREVIRELYKPDWKAWFSDEGGIRNGSPKDPRIVLIEVEAHEATYLKSNQPRAVQLFKVAKSLVTSAPPKLGEMHHVDKKELEARR